MMDRKTKTYLAKIGRKGGRASRRVLSAEQARLMVRIREARKAYRQFYTRCFWSHRPDYKITANDLGWVVDTLRRQGGMDAWMVADRLCR